jgi:hypothetical protein
MVFGVGSSLFQGDNSKVDFEAIIIFLDFGVPISFQKIYMVFALGSLNFPMGSQSFQIVFQHVLGVITLIRTKIVVTNT